MSNKDIILQDGDLEPAGPTPFALKPRRFAFDTFVIAKKEGRQSFKLPKSAKFCAFTAARGHPRFYTEHLEYAVTYLHETTDTRTAEFTLQVVENGEVFECAAHEYLTLVESRGTVQLIQWHTQHAWGMHVPEQE